MTGEVGVTWLVGLVDEEMEAGAWVVLLVPLAGAAGLPFSKGTK